MCFSSKNYKHSWVYILNTVGCYCGITTDPGSDRSPRSYQMDRMDVNMFIFIVVVERIEEVRNLVFEAPHTLTFLLEEEGFPFSKS